MKKWWIATAGLTAAYTVGIGVYFSNQIMYMKKKEDDFIKNREITAKRLDLAAFTRLPQTEHLIFSPAGYMVKAIFVEPYQHNKWVIICHGVTENKTNSIKYMNLFIKLGFNAIIYDHRRHGESGGKTSSYGHYEKDDLKAVIDELKKQKGENLILGIHGESMGAVSMLLYAGMIEDSADFYIADCPFSDFEELLTYQLQEKIPFPHRTVLPIGRFFIRLRDSYWTSEVSPQQHIQKIKKPVLFIHSEPDTFIPPSMTKELYKLKLGPKQLYLAPRGAHAQSYIENTEEYEKVVTQFIDQYVL